MCLLGNITITEANVRQNTGKEKQSEKELPDIQTGSFHIHYCISKRQVLTAHFCSARKERGIFLLLFSFFLLVCLKSVHECFFSHFSRWTNRWTLELHGMLRERGTVRLVGLATPDSPHCSVHATSLHYRVLWKHVCELGWMGTLGRAGDRC